MQKKSLIKQNILLYLNFIGITPYKFYQDTGITRGILTQDNGMSEENTAKFLAYYPDINPEWLITGKGTMLKDTEGLVTVNEPNEPYRSINTKTQSIPLVSATAIGGLGNSVFAIGQKDVKDNYVIPKFQNKKVDFMIEVEGSSMYPKYNSGDVVACRIINDQTFIQWNKTHVIATKDQGIIIKRINPGADGLMMVSDNKEYPPFEVPKTEIDGIALVVGVIRLE
jgi:repressor LexA